MADIRAGVAGATGYTGIELVRLLSGHPHVQITCLTSESASGASLHSIYPHLGHLHLPDLMAFDPARVAKECEVLFLARGNGWAMEHARQLLDAGLKVIDLAADFRLKDTQCWAEYYGQEHTAADLLEEAVYGLPELHGQDISASRLVANPGCYPTSAILALAPALATGITKPDGVVVASASGVSGAGRSRTETAYLFGEINENFRAYNVLKHRHTPEIDQELSTCCGRQLAVTFTPHLLPITRGINTTAYAEIARPVDTAEAREHYAEFYKNAPFVRVLEQGRIPETKQVSGSNYCLISPIVNTRTGRLVVLAVIDNLVKGASGQAIQNMNLMFGLEETAGLPGLGVYP